MDCPTSEMGWAGNRGSGGVARMEVGASSKSIILILREQISQLNLCSQLHPLNGGLQPLCDYDIAPNCSHEWGVLTFVGLSCTHNRLPWALQRPTLDGHH